jgi:signal transduction histidine kinase
VMEELFDALPDSIVFLRPLFSGKIVEDFELVFANRASRMLTGTTPLKPYARLLRDHLPLPSADENSFEQLLHVYETGSTLQDSAFTTSVGPVSVTRKKFRDGVLNIFSERDTNMVSDESEPDHVGILNGIIQNAPVGMVLYQSIRNQKGEIVDFRCRLFNREINRLTGYTDNERHQLPLSQLLKGTGVEANFERYKHTVLTGTPFSLLYFFERTQKWLQFRGVKMGDGFLSIVTDLTEKKEQEEKIRSQASHLNSILDASLNGIYVVEAIRDHKGSIVDFIFKFSNQRFEELSGIVSEPNQDKSITEVFPELQQGEFLSVLKNVVQTGMPARKEIFYEQSMRWFRYSIVRLPDNAAVVTFEEVTQERLASAKIEEQQALLNNILSHSPMGISVTEMIRDDKQQITDARTILVNDAACEFLGISKEQYLELTTRQVDPGIIESPLYALALKTLKTGQPFHTQYHIEGSDKWIELSVAKLDDDRLINVFTDITSTKEIQLEVERMAHTLRTVFDAAQMGMFMLQPVLNASSEVVDFTFTLVNPAFSGYVRASTDEMVGDRASKWFPGYLRSGIFDMYRHTYETGEAQRKEVHYHEDDLDLYLDLQSIKINDEVLVTFADFTDLKQAQLQLEKSVEELQRSNANLEEFAYAASHDMQEPIRKINFFANRIREQHSHQLDEAALRYFSRLEAATERMRLLIDDLLSYSHVSRQHTAAFEMLDLNQKLTNVLVDLELLISEKDAVITSDKLPKIKGYRRQLQQLFMNLITNAIKYSKPDEPPRVHISCRLVQGRDIPLNLSADEITKEFYLLQFRDNGIGFEQKDAERIFNVFQRLHGSAEYRGTGIGLSIVRKVMLNHHGYINAESEPGVGSVFNVYFPVPEPE